MNRPCASCGLHSCNGIECYLADPEPEEEATISTLTLDDLRKMYGDPLTETKSDPFLPREWAA